MSNEHIVKLSYLPVVVVFSAVRRRATVSAAVVVFGVYDMATVVVMGEIV